MDERKDILGMLDLMVSPVFCVQDQKIVKLNPTAQGMLLTEGTPIFDLLLTGKEEYAVFDGGCLYLTVSVGGEAWGATVNRVEDLDIFLLEQEQDRAELRSMALAARELREPLTNVLITADRLFPMTAQEQDPQLQEQVARLNRGLYQMLRILGNMADAGQPSSPSRMETWDIAAVLEEVFCKARDLMEHTGVRLTYDGIGAPVYTLADREQLERAVLNILSNALKFTPRGGSVEAKLSRKGKMLTLSIQDSGSGIAENLLSSLFRRYLRQPTIEDSRFGIGLGMVLIRNAATCHGGTVLVDRPEGLGTRVTMTLAIRQATDTKLHSPILRVDYAGERDHGLLEFSESLPAHLYEKE